MLKLPNISLALQLVVGFFTIVLLIDTLWGIFQWRTFIMTIDLMSTITQMSAKANM